MKGDMLPDDWPVVFLVDGLTSQFGITGGDRHFLEVARNWAKAGVDIIVLTPRVGMRLCESEGLHVPYRTLPFPWVDKLGLVICYMVRGISAVFRLPWRRPRMILYSASDFLPDTLPGMVAKLIKRGSAVWVTIVHHVIPPPARRPGSYLTNWISYKAQRASYVLMRRWADLVFIGNPLLESQLESIGFEQSRLVLTSYGAGGAVTTEDQEPGYDGCFLGRLHPTKGIFDLPRIWRRVCDLRPGSKLAIIGGGPRETVDRLREELEREGLDGLVEVLGYLPREEVDQTMRSSRVFLFPSHEEGFGISAVEAMRFGLPVVAYELPHYRKVFGDAMTLVPVGDTERLALEVVELLRDEKLRRKKSTESQEMAESFTWENVARNEAVHIAQRIERNRRS